MLLLRRWRWRRRWWRWLLVIRLCRLRHLLLLVRLLIWCGRSCGWPRGWHRAAFTSWACLRGSEAARWRGIDTRPATG